MQQSESPSRNNEALITTKFGEFKVQTAFSELGVPDWVVAYRDPWEPVPLLRIHSSCLYSESFSALDCDCSLQLDEALRAISEVGGAVVYLYQEGRGQGLFRKTLAMQLERKHSVETAEAYQQLGFELDPRKYSMVGDALRAIGFPRRVRLATNNPRKVSALAEQGFEVVERVSQKLTLTDPIRRYLGSKVRGLGHYDQD